MQTDVSKKLLDKGYRQQRTTVVRLLKDWPNQFGPTSLASERGSAVGDPSQLTPEQLKRMESDKPLYRSYRLLEQKLASLKTRQEGFAPYYAALRRVFLHEDAEYSNYEMLSATARMDEKAAMLLVRELEARSAGAKNVSQRNLILAYANSTTDAMRLYRDVEEAIHLLTVALLDYDIVAAFAEKAPPIQKTMRRITMEEKYREIKRVFDAWCEDLSHQHKKYRNKAYEATAITCNQPRSSVERAVRFCAAQEKKEVAA